MWRFSIATKQQIAGFPTISDKVIFPTIVKPLISNKNVQNRPESEQFREMLGVFYFQKQIRKPGAGKEVMQMPRMPKYLKREWAFFLGDCGRKKYNPLCRKCERSCKQSFRAVVILCTQYKSKRSIKHGSGNAFRIMTDNILNDTCGFMENLL